MKILTLNTHSLAEDGYEEKLQAFASVVKREQPDIMGLQEVNQSVSAAVWPGEMLPGSYVACQEFAGVIRRDNHAARLAELLLNMGRPYYWTWIPAKLGYGKYDEGLALFSRFPIAQTDSFIISGSRDYQNWRTRRALGIRIFKPEAAWLYTVHMGWWDDEEEPFSRQWNRLEEKLPGENDDTGLWIMGDFNSPDQVRGQGYDYVQARGWSDTYRLARIKDEGITVEGAIDGWKDKVSGSEEALLQKGIRIDYIWSHGDRAIESSRVICDGKTEPRVSDHYGVQIVTEKTREE